jgi:hypothetical protein
MAKRNSPNRMRQQVYRYAGALVAVVFVALFVQKSDGNTSAETLLLLGLGSCGVALVAFAGAAVASGMKPIRQKLLAVGGRRFAPVVALCVGSILIGFSLYRIDAGPSDFSQQAVAHPPVFYGSTGLSLEPPAPNSSYVPQRSSPEVTHESDKLAVRNMVFAENGSTTRVAVSIVNKSESPVVLSGLGINLKYPEDRRNTCYNSGPQMYQVVGDIDVAGNSEASGSLLAKSGSLAGFTTKIRGRGREDICYGGLSLALQAEISTSLAPLETLEITIDFIDGLTVENSPSSRVKFEIPPSSGRLAISLNENGVDEDASVSRSFGSCAVANGGVDNTLSRTSDC